MLSNVRKFKEEEISRSKEMFTQLFSLFPLTSHVNDVPYTSPLSQCTFNTNTTANLTGICGFNNIIIFKGKTDSFRRITDIRSLLALKSSEEHATLDSNIKNLQ